MLNMNYDIKKDKDWWWLASKIDKKLMICFSYIFLCFMFLYQWTIILFLYSYHWEIEIHYYYYYYNYNLNERETVCVFFVCTTLSMWLWDCILIILSYYYELSKHALLQRVTLTKAASNYLLQRTPISWLWLNINQ